MTQGSHYIVKDRLKLSMLEGRGASLDGEREKLLTVGSYYVVKDSYFPGIHVPNLPLPPQPLVRIPHPTPIPFVFLPSLLLILFSSPPTSAPHPLLFSLPCLSPCPSPPPSPNRPPPHGSWTLGHTPTRVWIALLCC